MNEIFLQIENHLNDYFSNEIITTKSIILIFILSELEIFHPKKCPCFFCWENCNFCNLNILGFTEKFIKNHLDTVMYALRFFYLNYFFVINCALYLN